MDNHWAIECRRQDERSTVHPRQAVYRAEAVAANTAAVEHDVAGIRLHQTILLSHATTCHGAFITWL